jgi:hypothetical protein
MEKRRAEGQVKLDTLSERRSMILRISLPADNAGFMGSRYFIVDQAFLNPGFCTEGKWMYRLFLVPILSNRYYIEQSYM